MLADYVLESSGAACCPALRGGFRKCPLLLGDRAPLLVIVAKCQKRDVYQTGAKQSPAQVEAVKTRQEFTSFVRRARNSVLGLHHHDNKPVVRVEYELDIAILRKVVDFNAFISFCKGAKHQQNFVRTTEGFYDTAVAMPFRFE